MHESIDAGLLSGGQIAGKWKEMRSVRLDGAEVMFILQDSTSITVHVDKLPAFLIKAIGYRRWIEDGVIEDGVCQELFIALGRTGLGHHVAICSYELAKHWFGRCDDHVIWALGILLIGCTFVMGGLSVAGSYVDLPTPRYWWFIPIPLVIIGYLFLFAPRRSK